MHLQACAIANAENCNVERFKSEALLRWIEKLSKARLPGRWLMRRRHVQQCIKVQVIPNVESKVVESRERFVVLQTSKETWNGFHASIENVNLKSASQRDVCQEFDDRLSMKRDVSGIKSFCQTHAMCPSKTLDIALWWVHASDFQGQTEKATYCFHSLIGSTNNTQSRLFLDRFLASLESSGMGYVGVCNYNSWLLEEERWNITFWWLC